MNTRQEFEKLTSVPPWIVYSENKYRLAPAAFESDENLQILVAVNREWKLWQACAAQYEYFMSRQSVDIKRLEVEIERLQRESIVKELDFKPDEQHTISDMANVGYSLMQTIGVNKPGYMWSETPAEIVVVLMNEAYDLERQINSLLAVNAEKDKALQFYADGKHISQYEKYSEIPARSPANHWRYDNAEIEDGSIAEQALSLTPDSVRLVEVGFISLDGEEIFLNNGLKIDEKTCGVPVTKLYTIEEGEAG